MAITKWPIPVEAISASLGMSQALATSPPPSRSAGALLHPAEDIGSALKGGDIMKRATPPTTANKEKAPAARPGLGWDLTDRTIMVARSLHNSAISENRCNFLDNDQHFLDNRWGDLCFEIQ